jgi:hypothetical protein
VDSVVAALPEHFELGKAHHVQVQITRGLIKQSLCYLWFDGGCVELTNQEQLHLQKNCNFRPSRDTIKPTYNK